MSASDRSGAGVKSRTRDLQVSVRRARDADVEALNAIMAENWKVDLDHRRELSHSDSIVLVAEALVGTRRVVGACLMRLSRWNGTGQLVELAVRKKDRRRRVGSALVSGLSHLAEEDGLRAIVAETQPGNQAAVGFYLSNGFRLCGYNDRYYTNSPRSPDEVALFFSLDLSPRRSPRPPTEARSDS